MTESDAVSFVGSAAPAAAVPAAAVGAHRVGWRYRSLRRSLDITVSLVTLVGTFPLFLVVAMFIRMTSRGPVFYSQTRVGRGGEEFTIVKFRTMRDGADRELLTDDDLRRRYLEGGYKLGVDDPRITRVGRWLRKSSLDELPQLINVLSGQMSVVGVRPLLPEELAERSEDDRALYRSLRPGLTGLWQVTGRSALETETRVELDRRYLSTCSFRLDLAILMRTPAAVARFSHAH